MKDAATAACPEASTNTGRERLGGLIAAAGMSSRMRAFKPMLPFGDRSMIELLIDAFREQGADPIVVVTGHNSDILERHLSGSGVETVYNADYQNSQMLDSVKMGIARLAGRCDSILFSPADVPILTGAVINKLMEFPTAPVVIPSYQGKDGHPVILRADLFDDICSYDGDGGLRGFFLGMGRPVKRVKVDDARILRDADTPEDYLRLVRENDPLQREDGCPGTAECLSLLIRYGTPPEVILHGAAVAGLALELAEKLKRAGAALDVPLIYGAALLHDVAASVPEHAKAGANWLAQEGYCRVASIVERHMELSGDDFAALSEEMVVYYADKRVRGRRRVSLRERFEESLTRMDSPEAIEAHTRRWRQAQIAERLIEEFTGAE